MAEFNRLAFTRTHSRRDVLRAGGRLGVAAAVSGPLATALAACGQQEGSGAKESAALATPGTDIPTVHVDFSMSPFADDTLPVISMVNGWFKDVGVEIGPTPTGAKLNLTESVAPLVSNQVQAGSAVFAALLGQLDTLNNVVRSFVIHGDYEGFAFFAQKGTPAKSVAELTGEGNDFETAVAMAIGQFKGQRLAIATDPSARLFYDLVFDLAGLKRTDFQLRELTNPNIVNLALSDRVDLAAPSGGPQVVRLAEAGLKLILTQQEVLNDSPDPRRLRLVNHSSFITRNDWYNDNYETVLRMASAIFRASDLVRNDHAAAARAQLPFLNAYAGSSVTQPQLKFLQERVSNELTFDELSLFYTKPGARNVYEAGQAQIDRYVEVGLLKRAHKVEEIEGSKKVWQDLMRYRTKADELFKTHSDGDKEVLAAARKQYDARNYLDAYRFLASLDDN
jgi:ABC-type nitrate/sulfonate/bicarbonate transport system substrate-binding protein